jgi:hypothetical protein
LPNTPIKIDYKQFTEKCIASIGAISSEKGCELIMSHPKSINQTKFSLFLDTLRKKYPKDKITLFLDRISFHISDVTLKQCEKLGFKRILNGSYQPDFNAAEGAIFLCKH